MLEGAAVWRLLSVSSQSAVEGVCLLPLFIFYVIYCTMLRCTVLYRVTTEKPAPIFRWTPDMLLLRIQMIWLQLRSVEECAVCPAPDPVEAYIGVDAGNTIQAGSVGSCAVGEYLIFP